MNICKIVPIIMAFALLIHMAIAEVSLTPPEEIKMAKAESVDELSLADLLNLNAEVLSVSKTKESADLAPASVTVLARKDLQDWNIDYFYEIAGRTPGLAFYDIDYSGLKGFITRGIPGIWRMGFSYNLAAQADWGWQVFSPNFIKSVEISRGPAGLTWGSNAMFGHINVNFRDDLEGTQVEIRLGENNFQHYDVMYGKQFDKGEFLFTGYSRQMNDPGLTSDFSKISGSSGDKWKSVAYGDGTDLLVTNAKYGRFSFNLMRSTAIMPIRMHWFDQGPFQEDLKRQAKEPVAHRFEALVYRMQYNLLDSDLGNLHLYYNADHKHFWIETFYQSREKHYQIGFNGNLKFIEDQWQLAFGGDLYDEHKINAPGWQASWIRDDYAWTGRDDGTFGGQKGIATVGAKRNFFLQGSYTALDQLKFVAGGRLDWQEDREPDEGLFMGPRLGVIWFPIDLITAKYVFNTTPRPPAGNEMQATPIPEPERLIAHDVIVNLKKKDKFNVQMGWFYQELADIIVAGESPFDYSNMASRFTSTGTELGVKYIFHNMFNWTLNGTFTYTDVPQGVAGIPRDKDGRSLAVPMVNTFTSLQFIHDKIGTCNLNMRSFFNMPYQTGKNELYDKVSVTFLDLRFESRRFFNELFSCGISVKNILDEDKKLPLLGEHTAVSGTSHPYPGSVSPTPRQLYVFANAHF